MSPVLSLSPPHHLSGAAAVKLLSPQLPSPSLSNLRISLPPHPSPVTHRTSHSSRSHGRAVAGNKSSKHFTASNRWQAAGARSREKRISVDDAKHIVLAVARQQVGPSNGRERPSLHSRSVRRGLGFNEALLRSVSGGVSRATQMTKS